MEHKRLKVAMICHFTNEKVQGKLKLNLSTAEELLQVLKHKPVNPYHFIGEYSVFVTNAIAEYERMTDEIELHVVTPHPYLIPSKQEFDLNGIHYHFFSDEDQSLSMKMRKKLIPLLRFSRYYKNRKCIRQYLEQICPDIVYMIGIECPFYAAAALDIPKTTPLVVQLQTLMCDPDFEKNYPISHESYIYQMENEIAVLKRADYIGVGIKKYINIIKSMVKFDAVTVNTRLAIGEPLCAVSASSAKKDYDFVYFAANINKAFDLALEGFAIAHKAKPNCTLHVIGAYSVPYKNAMDARIRALGLESYISFTGRLPTHKDVLMEIQRAHFALLPLKIDITSGTVREAMAYSLPVVTTITNGGTPLLNETRETVLLSPIGDHEALANNMLRLMNNKTLADRLRENGRLLVQERYDNHSIVVQQKNMLFAAYENFTNGTPIPQELLS